MSAQRRLLQHAAQIPHLSQCLNLVQHDGEVRELDQGLGLCERQWAQSGAEATHEDEGLQAGGARFSSHAEWVKILGWSALSCEICNM